MISKSIEQAPGPEALRPLALVVLGHPGFETEGRHALPAVFIPEVSDNDHERQDIARVIELLLEWPECRVLGLWLFDPRDGTSRSIAREVVNAIPDDRWEELPRLQREDLQRLRREVRS